MTRRNICLARRDRIRKQDAECRLAARWL